MRTKEINKYNINKAKFKIKVLTVIMAIFGLITILLVFGSIYYCEMNIYTRTVTDGEEEIKQMTFGDSSSSSTEDALEGNNKKITFANMAFGIDIDENNLSFIPVEQDNKFLLIFLAQAIIYLFIFTKFKTKQNLDYLFKFVGGSLLLILAITMVIFFSNYAKEIEAICSQAIEEFRSAYPDLSITSTIDTSWPSRVDVSISPIVGISTGFMFISSVICFYISIVEKAIIKVETKNAK